MKIVRRMRTYDIKNYNNVNIKYSNKILPESKLICIRTIQSCIEISHYPELVI